MKYLHKLIYLHRAVTINNGFTFLELLIVIGIIGILSSIVLSSLNNARGTAFDSKVKSQLSNIRSAAEVYYITNGNYGPVTGNASSTINCASGMFADTASGLSKLSISANYPVGENTIVCYSNGSAYAVSDNLYATTTYWCVDSTPTSKAETVKLGVASSTCM